jgi:ketosteroid isomerase-like protein
MTSKDHAQNIRAYVLARPASAGAGQRSRDQTAVEDRYKEWLAAANKKDAAVMTNLYDDNAVLRKNLIVCKKQNDGKIFRYMFDEIPAKK